MQVLWFFAFFKLFNSVFNVLAVVELWAWSSAWEVHSKSVKFHHVIKFHKVPKLFLNHKVRIVCTVQLCLSHCLEVLLDCFYLCWLMVFKRVRHLHIITSLIFSSICYVGCLHLLCSSAIYYSWLTTF